MGREYARVKLTIWTDPDFRNLSESAQRLYFLLLTSGDLNYCGVTDWRTVRLAALAADSTEDGLRHAAWELGKADLIAVDPGTEEVLVRSFVRHDGVLGSPNITKAMVREYGAIASQKLMALVSREVRRGLREDPEAKGAEHAKPVTKQFPEADRNPFEMVPDWFRNGSAEPSSNPSEMVPFGFPHPLPSPSPSLQVESVPARASRKRPAHPLPDDWEPNDNHRETARTEGVDLARAVDRFRNHAKANDRRQADWNAAFRNWLTSDYSRRPSNGAARHSKPSEAEWWEQQLAAASQPPEDRRQIENWRTA